MVITDGLRGLSFSEKYSLFLDLGVHFEVIWDVIWTAGAARTVKFGRAVRSACQSYGNLRKSAQT